LAVCEESPEASTPEVQGKIITSAIFPFAQSLREWAMIASGGSEYADLPPTDEQYPPRIVHLAGIEHVGLMRKYQVLGMKVTLVLPDGFTEEALRSQNPANFSFAETGSVNIGDLSWIKP
jgi:hypothetical protein